MENLELLAAAAEQLGCEVSRQEAMDKHTTFKIGGPAELFLTVETVDALRAVLLQAKELGVPYHVIGKGSNLLVSDAGMKGVVIQLAGDFLQITQEGNAITCGAAAPLSSLCKTALDAGLTGMEFAWGIPGSAGGALFMNAGAYGSEMKNVVTGCTCMLPDGTVRTMTLDELDLAYRHSIFHTMDAVILTVTVTLAQGDAAAIKAAMDDFIHRRKTKQPLEYPSAGSVFKRPVGYFAGALVEECGLKGKQIGGAMVSEKHAGFIINVGGATCQDVLDLVQFIQETVKREKGVDLECEIRPVS